MRWFFALGFVAVVIGTGLFLWKSAGPEHATSTPSATKILPSGPFSTQKPPRMPPMGQKEYRNTTYRFSIFYPDSMTAKEHTEPGTSLTVVFSNAEEEFQIFITPYGESQITQQRFLRDVPSGVREQEQAILLDGVQSVAFLSTSAGVGETIEIWGIANGFLYEVTAPRAEADKILSIVGTWQFL